MSEKQKFLNNPQKAVAAVAVIAVLLVILIVADQKRTAQITPQSAQKEDFSKPSAKTRIVDLDQKAVLASFTQGFPIESGASGLKAYRYAPANSLENQYTLEYTSSLSMAVNQKIFDDYLKSAGFKIMNQGEYTKVLFYYASKDNQDLTIKLEQGDSGIKVSASYLVR